MDPESLGKATINAPRKVKFVPKAPRREKKPIVPKVEKVEGADADAAKEQELLRRFNESSTRAKPKLEKKSSYTRVAFGYDGSSSMRSYGTPKGLIGINKSQVSSSGGGGASTPGLTELKEYKEPWDYYTNYPVTLPLRRPYSGNPEFVDEKEFGEDSESMTCDEYSANPAAELGIMEENLEASMFFLQLPATMPLTKPSANIEGHEMADSSKPLKGSSAKACGLDELPAGFMGKMLVYRSGAVKLKLGDILYNVSAGLDCIFAQDVVAINTEEKHFCVVGELSKRATITPDVDSILDEMSGL